MAYIDNSQIRSSHLYRALLLCGIISGVFAAVAAGLLLISAYHAGTIDRENVAALQSMRKKYEARPHKDALAQKIRVLDVQIRRDELGRQRFGQTGKVYFAAGILTAVVCLLVAKMLLRPEPVIPKKPLCAGDFSGNARNTRIAVAAVAAVIAASGLVFVFLDLN